MGDTEQTGDRPRYGFTMTEQKIKQTVSKRRREGEVKGERGKAIGRGIKQAREGREWKK